MTLRRAWTCTDNVAPARKFRQMPPAPVSLIHSDMPTPAPLGFGDILLLSSSKRLDAETSLTFRDVQTAVDFLRSLDVDAQSSGDLRKILRETDPLMNAASLSHFEMLNILARHVVAKRIVIALRRPTRGNAFAAPGGSGTSSTTAGSGAAGGGAASSSSASSSSAAGGGSSSAAAASSASPADAAAAAAAAAPEPAPPPSAATVAAAAAAEAAQADDASVDAEAQAAVLQEAAVTGAPFCEECEKLKKAQADADAADAQGSAAA
jgi:hypothetical protein